MNTDAEAAAAHTYASVEGVSTDGLESIDSLRYMLEELLHQLEFLQKSQQQLQDAINEKYDEEFSVAMFENEEIIAAKRARACRIHELLLTRDASYRAEPFIAEAGAALLDSHSTATVADAAALEDSSGVGVESEHSNSSISNSTLSDRVGLYV